MGIIKCAFSIWTGTLKLFWNICHHHEMSGSKRNENGCLFCEKHQSLSTWTPFFFSVCQLEWADGPNTDFENSESLYNNALLEILHIFRRSQKRHYPPPTVSRISFSSCPFQYFLSKYLVIAILFGMEWSRKVVLIYITLMLRDIEIF